MQESPFGSGNTLRLLIRREDLSPQGFPWGNITWVDNAEISGTETLTLGLVEIQPGEANPPHSHPNCDEVLHVLEGELLHTLGPEGYHLKAGDTLHIPQGVPHQARNSGTTTCRLVVAYNTGRRQVVGEF